MVTFCRRHAIAVATRGQGHSTFGQGLVSGLLIESHALDTIHSIGPDSADVDAGVTWRELTLAAYDHGLTPPVLTGYIGLSIGGTLSMAGVSSTNTAGCQVDRVRELEVVTGAGQTVRCSMTNNRELFEVALAGIGQCGIMTRATVDLVPAPSMVRQYDLKYADNATFFRDLRTLLARGEPRDVFGQWWLPGETGNVYHINAAAFYEPGSPPDDARLLDGLSIPASSVARTDVSYLDYAQRVDFGIDFLRQAISWNDLVKPWFDVWLGGARIEQYVGEIIPTLTQTDVGAGGFVLLFPQKRSKLRRPFMSLPVPDETGWVYLLDILTTSNQPGPDAAFASQIVARNRALFERARARGGTRYPISSIPFSQQDWRVQYGPLWPELVRRKAKFDPDGILTPGPGIFG